jgi:Tfp pilus assembly protein PilF
MRRALELDPYDYSAQSNQGLFLYYAGHYREAAATLEETLTHKDLISAHTHLGDVYCHIAMGSSGADAQSYFARALRQADLVEDAVRHSMAQSPPVSGAVTINYADRMHAWYYLMSGHAEAARPYLERLEADTAAERISPVALARIYASLGDVEHSLPLLERAAANKDRLLLFVKVIPEFDQLRGLPRFQALVKSMGL